MLLLLLLSRRLIPAPLARMTSLMLALLHTLWGCCCRLARPCICWRPGQVLNLLGSALLLLLLGHQLPWRRLLRLLRLLQAKKGKGKGGEEPPQA